MMKIERLDIAIDDVKEKRHVRAIIGDVSDLQDSIERFGILHPIVIARDNELITGARRLQACRNLANATVPALRIDTSADSIDALVIQSDENLCRQPLDSAEMDALIQRKKSMVTGAGKGAVRGGLKKLFSR